MPVFSQQSVARVVADQVTRGMLSVREAAEILGLRESTVRAWLLRRKIACVKLSARCVRIPREEVDRLIRDNLIPARAVRG
jgi:excisionase family DNA binding protein